MTLFTRTEWINESSPDITAEELNRIEEGIESAHLEIESAVSTAGAAAADAASAVAIVNAHLADEAAHGGSGGGAGLGWYNLLALGAVGDDTTYNTTLFQSVLDEIGVNGGGVFYLPFEENNNAFKTQGLYVWSNTRIICEPGVILRMIGASPTARNIYNENEPEQPQTPKYATALFTLGPMKTIGNEDRSDNVHIENCRITVGDSWNLKGVQVDGRKFVMKNVTIEGSSYDAMELYGGNLDECHFINCTFKEARRNCVSITGWGKNIVFDKCIFSHCTGGRGNPEGDANEQMPGCGMEIEPDYNLVEQLDISFVNCVFEENAGAGAGIIPANGGMGKWGPFRFVHCAFRNNGKNSADPLTGGGLYLAGTVRGGFHRPRVYIDQCEFTDNGGLGGAGIQFYHHSSSFGTTQFDVTHEGCYFRSNAGGTVGNSGANDGYVNGSNSISR